MSGNQKCAHIIDLRIVVHKEQVWVIWECRHCGQEFEEVGIKTSPLGSNAYSVSFKLKPKAGYTSGWSPPTNELKKCAHPHTVRTRRKDGERLTCLVCGTSGTAKELGYA